MNKMPTIAMSHEAETFRKQLFGAMTQDKKRRIRELQRGRVKSISLLEHIYLTIQGRRDGKLGLPREDDVCAWNSPILQKELDAQEEKCEKLWGTSQILLQPYYIRTESLLTVIAQLQQKIAERTSLLEAPSEDALTARKRGEEHLSEEQVHARRSRETEKRNAGIRAQIKAYRDEMEQHYEELAVIQRYIKESDHTARMTCQRIKDHTRQRIDCYWRAAFRTHPDNNRLPAAPAVLNETSAELTYHSQYEQLDQAIDQALKASRCVQEGEES